MLRAAIADRWREAPDTADVLVAAIARVAREAHADGLRPEELIVALKGIEAQVLGAPGTLRGNDLDARQRFRAWLVSACVRAYFAAPDDPPSDDPPSDDPPSDDPR